MRLSEMYYTIKNTLNHWVEPSFREEDQKGSLPSLYMCNNMRGVFDSLLPVVFLPEVEECLSEISKTLPSNIADGKPHYFSHGECNKVRSAISRLHFELSAMCSMCETLGMDEDSEGFDVKLPPNISLGDAAQCLTDMDIVFSQCPIFPDDGQIKFSGVDIGSTWLTFVVIGAGIAGTLRVVAELVDKAIALRSHRLAYRQEEEHLRSIQLSNDIIESIIAAHKAALDKMVGDTIQELSDSHNVTENEDKERLRLSLDRLGKWIDRGMEIHAGINAPTETKLLFPPIEKQSLPQEIIKALGEAEKEE